MSVKHSGGAVKAPGSLRANRQNRVGGLPKDVTMAGLVTACLAIGASGGASAQETNAASHPDVRAAPAPASGSVEKLPALNVEAASQKKKKRAASAPGGAASQAAAAPSVSGSSGQAQAAPGANPYADPGAPYKVNRSASGKLTEPLLNTARTITAIPKEVMEDKGATSVRELVRTTPGVTLGTGEGGNAYGDRLIIRGFDARNDVYIDGIRDPGVLSRENFATEQVEILKGPSATIGGRGTTGGAVNIVSKQPEDRDFSKASVKLGTDNTRRTTIDVNRVFSDEWAVRANGMWQNAEIAGRDEATDDRWGGALAVTYKPSEGFKITTDYYHLDTNAIPDWGVPTNPATHRPFTESGIPRTNWYGILGRDFYESTSDVVTTAIEARLAKDVKLTSKFRYGFSVVDYVASAPEGANEAADTVRANAKSRHQDNEVYANQTDLTVNVNTWGIRHTLVAGAEFSRENVLRDTYKALDSESFETLPSGIVLSLRHPNSEGLFNGLITRNNLPTDVSVGTIAGYLLDTVKIGDRWILNGGVRLDDYSIDQTIKTATAITELSRNDLLFNWNAGLAYKPAPNGTLYVAYATSSNPVGQELDAGSSDYGGLAINNAALAPEENTSAEAGVKWELFNRHLLATAAVFQVEKQHGRETVGSGAAAVVRDTGSYRVRGVEFGAMGAITSEWSVYGGVVLLDTEVVESAVASNVGLHLANTAHHSFSLLSKHRLTDRLTIGGQATYASAIYGGTFAANTPNILPEHWRFDALAEYQIDKHVSVTFNVLNITDELYYDAFYRSQNPFAYVAPGRAAYVTLNIKY